MPTLIGIWGAAELLTDALGPTLAESLGITSESAPMLGAFKFLRIAAAEERCVVRGRLRRNGMLVPIPADAWHSLTIDPIAAHSKDEDEYTEAQAHPTELGPDYHLNVWNDLRWTRTDSGEVYLLLNLCLQHTMGAP